MLGRVMSCLRGCAAAVSLLALQACADAGGVWRRGPLDASAEPDATGSVADVGPRVESDAALPQDAQVSADARVADDPCPTLGPFVMTPSWGSEPSHPLPSFVHDGRYYVHTQAGGERETYHARVRPEGGLDAWERGGDHGGGPHGFTAVVAGEDAYHFRNGHIARYRFDASGGFDGEAVDLLEESGDTAFGGNRYVWDSAVVLSARGRPDEVLHLGGFSFTGYEYRPDLSRARTPLAGRFERIDSLPFERIGGAAYVSREDESGGWVFVEDASRHLLHAAEWTSTGALESFREVGVVPTGDGEGLGDFFSVRSALFAIRGSTVYRTCVDASGRFDGFREIAILPERQIDISWSGAHLAGASWAVTGGFVYLTGPRRVYYAAIRSGA